MMTRQDFISSMPKLQTKMVKLAQEGWSGDDIAEQLELSSSQAERVHYELLKKGEIRPDLEFNSVRTIRMGQDSVTIPRSRFRRFGLDSLFPTGTAIRFRGGDGFLILEPSQDNPEDDSDVMEADESETPLMLDAEIEKSTGNAITLGVV